MKWLNFIFLIALYANASELRASDAQDATHEGPKPSGLSVQEYASMNKCPPLLSGWVNDDFSDKTSWFFKYKSEAKSCESSVRSYRDYLSSKKESVNFPDSEKLLNFYTNKFSGQISPLYKKSLDRCTDLSTDKASVAITRFYSTGVKLQGANSSILDEVSSIDSVLPDAGMLNGVECPSVWPNIKGKCDSIKIASRECKVPKKQQFDDLVKKTQEILPEIQDLITAQHNCIAKFLSEPGGRSLHGPSATAQKKIESGCDPIGAAIEVLENEIPWVRGQEFQKTTVKKAPSPRNFIFTTEYDLSGDTIAKGIAAQLKKNRAALVDSYKSNLEDFRCLSNNPAGPACDFNKIRSHLIHNPDEEKTSFSSKNSAEREARLYFEAENCLLERTEDRAQTKEIVDNSMKGIAVTAVTFGMGEVVAGIRVVNTTSKAARIRQGLLAVNTGTNAVSTGQGLYRAYNACSSETKAVIALSKSPNSEKENVCSNAKSGIPQATDRESSCIVSALLTAPSVLPFVGAIPSLKALIGAFGKESNNIKLQTVSTGISGDTERITYAEKLLDRPLSDVEKKALIDAHNYGTPQMINGKLQYSSDDIKEKAKILAKAGFKTSTQNGGQSEIRTLMENRVVGKFDDNSYLGAGSRDPGTKVWVIDPETGKLIDGTVVARKASGMYEVKIGEKKGFFKTTDMTQHYQAESVFQPVEIDSQVAVPRTGGYLANGRVVMVDRERNMITVEMPFDESRMAVRTYTMDQLQKPIAPGETVWVERTNGEYTRGRVIVTDTEVGVSFDEYGLNFFKRTEYSKISRTPPTDEMRRAAKERAQAKAREEAANERSQNRYNGNGDGRYYSGNGRASNQQNTYERDQAKSRADYQSNWERSPAFRDFKQKFDAQTASIQRLYEINSRIRTQGQNPELEKEAKLLYRKLRSDLHTDKYGGAPTDAQNYIKARFQEVKEQYESIENAN